jgi:hypothetical protein
VEVEERHVKVRFRSPCDTQQSICVRLVITAENSLFVCKLCELSDPYVEDARIFGISEEDCCSPVRKSSLESFDIGISFGVWLYDGYLVSLLLSERRICRMREERRDDFIALILFTFVTPICPHY